MICLGYNYTEKELKIISYINTNDILKVFVFQPEDKKFMYSFNCEYISYKKLIEYEYFYKVLQEADNRTLIVIDECLRTKNRNDLTYNCLRHFLNQAGHQLIFQYLPIIESIEDFMILFDFDTKSQWKREKYSEELMNEVCIQVNSIDIRFSSVQIPSSIETRRKYEVEKNKLINNIGIKDPHIIPRNLHLISGKDKVKYINYEKMYIARNNRYKIGNFSIFKKKIDIGNYIVFEFPHNFIDFTDFLFFSKQKEIPILMTDLKVDQWYYEWYNNWLNNLRYAYNSIIQ